MPLRTDLNLRDVVNYTIKRTTNANFLQIHFHMALPLVSIHATNEKRYLATAVTRFFCEYSARRALRLSMAVMHRWMIACMLA
uniref:Uncharacterized protein n=1 Tax=Parascaris univalens TaxID=6257 RepID=A0A915ALU5_PARUN